MKKEKVKPVVKENDGQVKGGTAHSAISYRLKCDMTANGLTHFVMYGDVPGKKMPL